MERKIVFVGYCPVSSGEVLDLDFNSDKSLLDGDVIVFSLDFSAYHYYESFQGLRCFDDNNSFRIKRDCQHWRSEMEAALKDGKTVIVFVNDTPEISVATGETRYSGTGRNARATRIVQTFEPYSTVPTAFGSVVRKSGERIKAVGDLGILATYWHEFGADTKYEAYIDRFIGTSLLETQTGGKTVAGTLRLAGWKGRLIFLPKPDLSSTVERRLKEIAERREKRRGKKTALTPKQKQRDEKKADEQAVGHFLSALVALDKAARSTGEKTPLPEWCKQPRFALAKEKELLAAINQNLSDVLKLQTERESFQQELQVTQQLKGLLYEKGKPLERAVLAALKTLGFQAEGLKEDDSEFDAVMVDPDGARLIGEVEGKDEKPINVDKLDQLDRNIREDFSAQNDATAQYAIGVLFGNAQRFLIPESRGPFFTDKCLTAAKRSQIVLVKTIDLYAVAQYLENYPNPEFAGECRNAIRNSPGTIVAFPALPRVSSESQQAN